MADTIDVAQVSQAFKERYNDGFIKASPVIKQLQEDFPFDDGGQPGVKYSEAIRMTDEQGITASIAGEDLTLLDPVALKMEKASFLGNKLEMRSRVSIEAVKRALASPQAMAETLFVRQESMRDSHMVHKEWTLMNGGQSLGEVESVAAGSSSAQKVVTLTAESWCPTWWARATNMKLDIYDLTSEDLDDTAVKRNTSSASAYYRVDDWDPEAHTVTLTASGGAGDWGSVVAGDRLWRLGFFLKESYGMARIAKDQTGSIFLQAPEGSSTIPVYGQWKGILDEDGGIFTMERVLRKVADIADRSEDEMRLTLRIPPRQYHGLNIELAASRYFDGSYQRKAQNGFQSIEFYSPSGTVTLKSYKYLKWGQALLTDDTCFSRRGVSDTTTVFEGSGEMYFLRQDINQLEFRSYSQDGMFCNKPFRACLFDGLSVPGES